MAQLHLAGEFHVVALTAGPRTGSARPPLRRAMATAAAVATFVAALTTAVGPAAADSPLDRARAQAHRLAVHVHELQNQAEAAAEDYDRASGTLSEAVALRLRAQDTAAVRAGAAAADRARAGEQARALYQSGGPLGEYAGVLNSGDVSSFADRITSVRRLAAADHALNAAAGQSAEAATAVAASLSDAEVRQVAAEQSAAAAAGRERALLAEQTGLLAGADAQVRDLLAQQQRDMAAAAEAAFQKQLADAYASAGLPLTTGSTATGPSGPVAAAAVTAMQTLVNGHPPYVWGGTGPQGYDCSGLTGAAYAAAGLLLPRTAAQQWSTGPHPALTQLQPGDLLFWADHAGNAASIHHVAMYAGGDLMWSTDHTGDVARLQPIWGDGFFGATRPVAAIASTVPGPQWQAGT